MSVAQGSANITRVPMVRSTGRAAVSRLGGAPSALASAPKHPVAGMNILILITIVNARPSTSHPDGRGDICPV